MRAVAPALRRSWQGMAAASGLAAGLGAVPGRTVASSAALQAVSGGPAMRGKPSAPAINDMMAASAHQLWAHRRLHGAQQAGQRSSYAAVLREGLSMGPAIKAGSSLKVQGRNMQLRAHAAEFVPRSQASIPRQPQTLARPTAAEPVAPPSSSSPADLPFLQPSRGDSGASSTSGRPLPRPFVPHSLPPRAWAHPSRRKHGLGPHTGWQRANVATYASAAAAQEVARASSASMPEPDRGGAVVPGALVEYQRDAQVGLALLLRADGKRNWLALNTRGQSYSLRPQQIAYVLPGTGYDEEALHKFATEAEAYADPSLMAVAWEIAQGGDDVFSVSEMAEFLFQHATPVSTYAAHRLLNEDRTYFKQVGRLPPRFQARPQEEVTSLLTKAAKDAQAKQELEDAAAAIRAATQLTVGNKPSRQSWLTGPFAHWAEALEAVALQRAEPTHTELAAKVISATGLRGASSDVAGLLANTGIWRLHEQACLLRARITETFFPMLEDEAADLAANQPPDPDKSTRIDLTHHTIVTIDDASTTEIDDGLSAEMLPDGRLRLWVHVADPSRWLQPGDPLDMEARRRATSLYLPTGAVFMFPKSLAVGLFSLREGQAGCALSFSAVLANDGALEEFVVTPSWITPQRRLTFSDVDAAILAGDMDARLGPGMAAMHEAAQLRGRWRQARGASTLNIDECQVIVKLPHSPTPSVTLQRGDNGSTPAQQFVAEMMIMAGEIAGTLGGRENLALAYRGQAPFVPPAQEELEATPPGPCRDMLLRSRMTRGVVHTDAPVPHAGLGLDAYVQVTSPIRRYNDLLAHWQLKAHLRGQQGGLWDTESLGELAAVATQQAQVAKELVREVTNYWLAYYFQAEMQADPNRIWKATLAGWVRRDTGVARVLLEESALETIIRLDRGASTGEQLELRCMEADPHAGMYRLAEANAPKLDELDPVVNEDADVVDALDEPRVLVDDNEQAS